MSIFQKLFNRFIGFLIPAAKLLAKAGGYALVNAAKDAVLAAEKSGGSGADKYNAARKQIIISLQSQGLPIVTNAINLAIEAAVAALSHKSPAAQG